MASVCGPGYESRNDNFLKMITFCLSTTSDNLLQWQAAVSDTRVDILGFSWFGADMKSARNSCKAGAWDWLVDTISQPFALALQLLLTYFAASPN